MKSLSGNTGKAESCLGLLILSGPCAILFLFCCEVPNSASYLLFAIVSIGSQYNNNNRFTRTSTL